jgi:hypothetical protein
LPSKKDRMNRFIEVPVAADEEEEEVKKQLINVAT